MRSTFLKLSAAVLALSACLDVCLDLRALQTFERAVDRLLEDEAGFIDFARSRLFVTEEHEIFDLRA